jgi:hypothetical protein
VRPATDEARLEALIHELLRQLAEDEPLSLDERIAPSDLRRKIRRMIMRVLEAEN